MDLRYIERSRRNQSDPLPAIAVRPAISLLASMVSLFLPKKTR
jgi:hypothetical protein